MPNVPTLDDVSTAVVARLKQGEGFKDLFPGGLWFGRRPGTPTAPYLVINARLNAPDAVLSDGSYSQTARVELMAVCPSKDKAAADTQNPAQFLNANLDWQPGNPTNNVSVPNATGTVLCRPLDGDLKISPELRRSQDVLLASKILEIRFAGQR